MNGRKISYIVMIIFSLLSFPSHAETIYRSFWFPLYQGLPLNYCSAHGKCGKPIADLYCLKMGYQTAADFQIRHNIGKTRFIDSAHLCRSSNSAGFRKIKCKTNVLKNSSYYTYYATKQWYQWPRIDGCLVDACYHNKQGCGKKAATAFCRRMGYKRAINYQFVTNLPQTAQLGSTLRCFSGHCKGFEAIRCLR